MIITKNWTKISVEFVYNHIPDCPTIENLILGVRWSPAPSWPGSNETFFTTIAHLPWDQCWSFQFSSNKQFMLRQVDLMSVTYLSLGNTFGCFRPYFNFLFLPVWNINFEELNMQLLFIFVACDFASRKKIFVCAKFIYNISDDLPKKSQKKPPIYR